MRAHESCLVAGLLVTGLPAALGCKGGDDPVGDTGSNTHDDCLTGADGDDDTISDCDEIALGTNPSLADTDGDGLTDPEEVQCVSSPVDAAERCYACGWKHNDPGDLVATGNADGNVIGNMQLVDQCLETVSLWDFATTASSPVKKPAAYHILFMTAAW